LPVSVSKKADAADKIDGQYKIRFQEYTFSTKEGAASKVLKAAAEIDRLPAESKHTDKLIESG